MSDSTAKKIESQSSSTEGAGIVVASGRQFSANEQSEFFGVVLDKSDMGPSGSLKYNILTLVLSEKYDPAIKELRDFLAEESPYPDYYKRIKPQVSYCIDLIYAIRAKRNFPGFNSLTRSKQQELREKFKEHFEELKRAQKKIENILIDLRIGDSRSTIMVIWSLWHAIVAVFALGVILDLTRGGVLVSIWGLVNEALIELYEALF